MISKQQKKTWQILAICLFVLCNICGMLGFYLIDKDTAFRAQEWDTNWYSELVRQIGVVRIDISFTMGFLWAIGYIGILVLAASPIFRKFFERLAARRGIAKKPFLIMYYVGAAIICAICLAISFTGFKLAYNKARYVILLFGYYFLPIVLLLVALALLCFVVMIIVALVRTQTGGGRVRESAAKGGVAEEGSSTIFPGLLAIDEQYRGTAEANVAQETTYTLNELASGFQAYLAQKCSLYYELPVLRAFIAGMSASRLIILEGLSGTGKSSLPRYFCEYVGSKAFFASVQATWRDRSDLLGFYNDFSGVFKEMPFLKRLYEASYIPGQFNMMVLDEMNISRIEYYFADFLSVMEYPLSDWKINIISHIPEDQRPEKLAEDSVVVPFNTWFIGTANKDDSTFTITDKVYDRAITIGFADQNARIQTTAPSDPVYISPEALCKLFTDACNTQAYQLSSEDMNKFNQIAQFIFDSFDIVFGNRIMNQLYIFVPVYVALGGSKEEALDFMLAGKIEHKLDGRFDDYLKDGLLRLQNLINTVYGPDSMPSTSALIRRLLKKLV